jgi:histidine kinase
VYQKLSVKIFFSYLAVITVGAVVLFTASQAVAPLAFSAHVDAMQMHMGRGMALAASMMADLYEDFRSVMTQAVLLATAASVLVALMVSAFVTQRITAPIRALVEASRHVARGDYSQKVEYSSSDEIAQLVASFNAMSAALARQEQLRHEFVTNVAHELRTPLTGLRAYLEAMKDGVIAADARSLELTLSELERITRLVDDLQELARMEEGDLRIEPEPVSLDQLLRTAIVKFQPAFQAKGVRLTLEVRHGLPEVLADRHRILQVMDNLLSNALRATPEGGAVSVTAVHEGSQVTVTVRDTGEGIPPSQLDQIFTRFYRVDHSRSRRTGGSGIGLTVAKHLVEAHGGRIWAESNGPGLGASFSFTLPIA